MKLRDEVQYRARLIGFDVKPAIQRSLLMFEVFYSNGKSDVIGIRVRNRRELNEILQHLDPDAIPGDDFKHYVNQTCLVEYNKRNGNVRILTDEKTSSEIAFAM